MFLFVCMIKLTKIEPWAIGLRVANLLKLQLPIHICKNNSAKSLLQLARTNWLLLAALWWTIL